MSKIAPLSFSCVDSNVKGLDMDEENLDIEILNFLGYFSMIL